MCIVHAILSLVLATGALASAEPPLEIRASLYGYNLLMPEARCCAFELVIRPDGQMNASINLASGVVVRDGQLSPAEFASLRQAILTAQFFDLPEDVGAMPVDGDEHRMQVRLGSRSRTVTLYDWPDDWSDAGYLSRNELAQTRRAYVVWAALRALVKEPQAQVP